MKKVITFGVFDYFHIGHLNLLEQAKELGDYLIVAVQEEESIQKYKKEAKIFYNTSDRVRLIKALRIVDEVVLYRDVDKDIQLYDFDIFAIGEDQLHSGFVKAVQWCKENGKEVERLRYTTGVSSKMIKREVK